MADVCITEFTDPACPWMDEARERLGRVAVEQHVGFDGFWTLPD
jgi:hypothetical protein